MFTMSHEHNEVIWIDKDEETSISTQRHRVSGPGGVKWDTGYIKTSQAVYGKYATGSHNLRNLIKIATWNVRGLCNAEYFR